MTVKLNVIKSNTILKIEYENSLLKIARKNLINLRKLEIRKNVYSIKNFSENDILNT